MLRSLAAAFGLSASLPFLAGAVTTTPPDLWWVPIVATVATGVFGAVAHAAAVIYAARKRARADVEDGDAKKALADGKTDEAKALALKAQEDRAVAGAVEKLGDQAELAITNVTKGQ